MSYTTQQDILDFVEDNGGDFGGRIYVLKPTVSKP